MSHGSGVRKSTSRERFRAIVNEEDFLREMVAAVACPFDGLAPGTPEAVESAVEHFRAAVHLLLKRYFGKDSAAAVEAYDAGVAMGMFGEQSAIAEGLRSRRSAQSPRISRRSDSFQAVLAGGCLHGRCVREWGLRQL